MTFTIAGYGDWYVYLDGKQIKRGNKWTSATKMTFTPSCGKHILKVSVRKRVKNNYAGLVYLLEQDDSKCKCSSNKWWNPYKCACECLTTCSCPSNKYWSKSSCACKCKPPSLPGGPSSWVLAPCPPGQYRSSMHCKCMCKPRWCEKGYFYNRTPFTSGSACRCYKLGFSGPSSVAPLT